MPTTTPVRPCPDHAAKCKCSAHCWELILPWSWYIHGEKKPFRSIHHLTEPWSIVWLCVCVPVQPSTVMAVKETDLTPSLPSSFFLWRLCIYRVRQVSQVTMLKKKKQRREWGTEGGVQWWDVMCRDEQGTVGGEVTYRWIHIKQPPEQWCRQKARQLVCPDPMNFEPDNHNPSTGDRCPTINEFICERPSISPPRWDHLEVWSPEESSFFPLSLLQMRQIPERWEWEMSFIIILFVHVLSSSEEEGECLFLFYGGAY